MIVDRWADRGIKITLESPEEQEIMDWIETAFGPGYLRKWLVRLFDEKRKAMKHLEVQRTIPTGKKPVV